MPSCNVDSHEPAAVDRPITYHSSYVAHALTCHLVADDLTSMADIRQTAHVSVSGIIWQANISLDGEGYDLDCGNKYYLNVI